MELRAVGGCAIGALVLFHHLRINNDILIIISANRIFTHACFQFVLSETESTTTVRKNVNEFEQSSNENRVEHAQIDSYLITDVEFFG